MTKREQDLITAMNFLMITLESVKTTMSRDSEIKIDFILAAAVKALDAYQI
jgi:hypothetical protein